MFWAVGRFLALGFLTVAASFVEPLPTRQTRAVTVDVTVTTQDSTPVTTLVLDDFRVLVEGVETPIASISSSSTPRPLSIVVMVDQSPSMSGLTSTRDDFNGPLDRVLLGSLPGSVTDQDRLQLGRIAGRASVRPVHAATRDALRRVLPSFASRPLVGDYWGSPIWDAVDTAARALGNAPGRRLIVLITDGQGTANHLSAEEAAERAIAGNAIVTVIDQAANEVVKQDSGSVRVSPSRALVWIAAATGGAHFGDRRAMAMAPDPSFTAQLVRRAIAFGRHTYALTLRVADVSTPRALDITVRQPSLVVHAPAFIAQRSTEPSSHPVTVPRVLH